MFIPSVATTAGTSTGLAVKTKSYRVPAPNAGATVPGAVGVPAINVIEPSQLTVHAQLPVELAVTIGNIFLSSTVTVTGELAQPKDVLLVAILFLVAVTI